MSDLHTVNRLQTKHLARMLEIHPVVILQGARQTGKTTLCQMPEIGKNRTYLTLDDYTVRDTAQRDPTLLFTGEKKITLDEVQREPDVLLAVKSAVDTRRENGRFLITGSAHLLLYRKVAESLAGRAVYFHLPGFTWAETEGRAFGQVLDALLAAASAESLVTAGLPGDVSVKRTLPEAVAAGGFPIPTLSKDTGFRAQWFDGYVQTYLERDLRDLSSVASVVDFRRLMALCAAQNGRLLNTASLARDAGLASATAGRYINLLEMSFQVVKIPAYEVNRGKRLVKAPKLYWADTGLAAHLAGFFSEEELTADRSWGNWIENWVAIHLLAYSSMKTPRAGVFHWRTSSGYEVDFVLQHGKRVVPIEVKSTSSPSGKHIKGLEAFLDTYEQSDCGFLICRCDKLRLLSKRTIALPIEHLLLN